MTAITLVSLPKKYGHPILKKIAKLEKEFERTPESCGLKRERILKKAEKLVKKLEELKIT